MLYEVKGRYEEPTSHKPNSDTKEFTTKHLFRIKNPTGKNFLDRLLTKVVDFYPKGWEITSIRQINEPHIEDLD